MEIIGRPPSPCWLKVAGVPLPVWSEGVFRLVGDCSGRTMEVDKKPSALKVLYHGRVEVLLEESQEFPSFVLLWIDDLLCESRGRYHR